MARIHYVEIENFKIFSKKIRIELGHPAVLIGPNNSGKTSVIQALSLWSLGVKAWYEKQGEPHKKKALERISAGLNRLNLLDVPVAETRFLWSGTHLFYSGKPITIAINVGIEYLDSVKDCRFIFTYQNSEVIYSKPDAETLGNDDLIRYSASLQFHLLYPMSGIMSGISADTEETQFNDGWIDRLLGQGQTAQVLRNICYKVTEQDELEHSDDWAKIIGIMKRIFLVDINKPVLNKTRGNFQMSYREAGTEANLDISLAGRGLQQVLLILAYLYWRKNSVLMIDEPDAHLEILRQRQIYSILNDIAHNNHGQIIIATHSEVILGEAADTNLTLLLDGRADNLAKQQIKNTLKTFGIEHYYKARVHPWILYVEGSTDIAILKALAARIEHSEAERILEGRLNVYYTKNVEAEDSLSNQLDRIGGALGDYRYHYNALKGFITELRGLAILGSDNTDRQDKIEKDFALLFWRNYEAENYFVSPKVLIAYATNYFTEEKGALFQNGDTENFKDTVNEILLEDVFNGNKDLLDEYQGLSAALQKSFLKTVKMSRFAETVFRRYAEKYNRPILLSKGEFYRLVPYCPIEEIPSEVGEKLDYLVKYLS